MMQQTWQDWQIVRELGAGSCGQVYEIARDVGGEVERAALKIIRIPHSAGEIDELRAAGYNDESIRQRFDGYRRNFAQEYAMMAKVKGHSSVVYCEDIQSVPNPDGIGWQIFIRMELLTPVMKVLSMVSNERQVIRLARDMCSALILCRHLGIVHRDIKPQNIFLSQDGIYKLGDFGVAKTANETSNGTKVGTYNYMAPEVYNNWPYGHSADLYSLGMVLYNLLNENRGPFLPLPPQVPTIAQEEASRARRFGGDPLPEPKNGSPALKAIVLKACAFREEDRFRDPAEMLKAINSLPGSQDIPPLIPPAQPDYPLGGDEVTTPTLSVFDKKGMKKRGTDGPRPTPTPTPTPTPAPTPTPGPVQVNQTPAGGRSRKPLILALSLLLFCAAAAGVFFLIRGMSSGSDTRQGSSGSSPAATSARGSTGSPAAEGSLQVEARAFSGFYDGRPHCIGVDVTGCEAFEIWFSAETALTADNCKTAGSLENCVRTDVGETKVWYYVQPVDGSAGKGGSSTVTVNPAQLELDVRSFTGAYDGNPHCIAIFGPAECKHWFSTEKKLTAENYKQDGTLNNPFRTDAGETTVWYYVEDESGNYISRGGSASIVVNPAPIKVNAKSYIGSYDGKAHCIGVTVTGTPDFEVWFSDKEALKGSNYTSGTKSNPTFTNAGTTKVWYYVHDKTGNYQDETGSGTVEIRKAQMDVTAKNYSGERDGKQHCISVVVKGNDQAVIYYSMTTALTASNYSSAGTTKNPTTDRSGVTTVWYYVKDTSGNFEDKTGSATVTLR